MDHDDKLSFGVFKPVGHVVISLPSRAQADAAVQGLAALNLPQGAVHTLTDQEMLRQIDHDLAQASPPAAPHSRSAAAGTRVMRAMKPGSAGQRCSSCSRAPRVPA